MRRTTAHEARNGPVADVSKPAATSHPPAVEASGDPFAWMLFLQRTVGNQALTSIQDAVRDPGRPLDAASRAKMEAAFGRDLGQVRVHTDGGAAKSAAAVHAAAYTVGQDVVFGDGHYAPDTALGRWLLAHELAHTIQQRDGAGPPPSNDPGGIHEQSARDAASNVAAGQPAQAPMPLASVGLSMNAVSERELAIMEAEAEIARMDKEEEEEQAQEKRERKPERSPQANQVTADMINAPLKEFRDREKAEGERKQIAMEALDETRPERFRMFRQVLAQHGYSGDVLASFMSRTFPMRDLLVLRRYGLEWARWYNRHKFEERVEAALDRYLADQHEAKYGTAPVLKELTKGDEEALRKEQYRQEFYKAWVEGLPHVTGSVSGGFGAWFTSLFTDDPKKITAGAKMGTAFSGSVGSIASAKTGSYVPEVEQPVTSTGMWRYKGPAPTVEVNPPKPGGPVAPKAPADPFAGVVQRPTDITAGRPYQAPPDPKAAIRDARLEVEQLQRLHEELSAKASQANQEARRVRLPVQALERKGQKPTQQQAETLAKHAELAKARDKVKATLDVAKEKLRALQPPEGAQKHGKAGLDQEAKYVDEQRAAGLPARLTDPNTPVIDAAIVGTPEVHSVKTITPHEGTERAVQLADAGSPRDLAVRIAEHVDTALMDRRSAKWSLLQRRWNTTQRESHAGVYGYDLPRNPDEIRFIVEVRVVSAKPPASPAQQRVQAEAAEWLKKNQRIPPNFTWRITYVSSQ